MNEDIGKLIEPGPVPFAFGAPGWYVFGGLLVMALLVVCWLLIHRHRRNRYRREALRELERAVRMHQQRGDGSGLVFDANNLLKRIAMGRYGRELAAGRRSGEWIGLLNGQWKGDAFDARDKDLLERVYASSIPLQEGEAFAAKAGQWIRRSHKRKTNNHAIRTGP